MKIFEITKNTNILLMSQKIQLCWWAMVAPMCATRSIRQTFCFQSPSTNSTHLIIWRRRQLLLGRLLWIMVTVRMVRIMRMMMLVRIVTMVIWRLGLVTICGTAYLGNPFSLGVETLSSWGRVSQSKNYKHDFYTPLPEKI